MASREVKVSLAFDADVSKAKKQIESLIDELNTLGTTSNPNLSLTKEIQEAQSAARQLSRTLGEAFNTETGKLDLSKFNQQLKYSKTSLSDYAKNMSRLGADGEKAFLRVAQSISTAEMPLKRTSSLLEKFSNTLSNTVRWQISSSLIHTVMSAYSSAVSYAKDLDESLNSIRIVTGYNVDKMAEFAEQANKAARALSTTTTTYTDASLIYYQQGNLKILLLWY